jgi:hypothetical protein
MQTMTMPSGDQLDVLASMIGGHAALRTRIMALKAAGAPITVDTIHATIVGGANMAASCARPDFQYNGGSRALGLL